MSMNGKVHILPAENCSLIGVINSFCSATGRCIALHLVKTLKKTDRGYDDEPLEEKIDRQIEERERERDIYKRERGKRKGLIIPQDGNYNLKTTSNWRDQNLHTDHVMPIEFEPFCWSSLDIYTA